MKRRGHLPIPAFGPSSPVLWYLSGCRGYSRIQPCISNSMRGLKPEGTGLPCHTPLPKDAGPCPWVAALRKGGSWAIAFSGAHKHSLKLQLYGSLIFPANNSICPACPPERGQNGSPEHSESPPPFPWIYTFKPSSLRPMCNRTSLTTRAARHRTLWRVKLLLLLHTPASPARSSSWSAAGSAVPTACRGGKETSGEGQGPMSISPTGGGRALHRKSLPPPCIGRRHLVSACLPRRGDAILGHLVTHVSLYPLRLAESHLLNAIVFSGLSWTAACFLQLREGSGVETQGFRCNCAAQMILLKLGCVCPHSILSSYALRRWKCCAWAEHPLIHRLLLRSLWKAAEPLPLEAPRQTQGP